ncbi:MAG: TOTE conflict system archaeo-eukaryotic primase domain-containing protein, partial [Planctomycetota bacterium]
MNSWTKQQKVAIFRRCFRGREDVYGTYDPATGRSYQVKSPVTDRVILDHLRGRRPYGVYLLCRSRTQALAVDFDDGEIAGPAAFLRAARDCGLDPCLERSKSKGYHVWL